MMRNRSRASPVSSPPRDPGTIIGSMVGITQPNSGITMASTTGRTPWPALGMSEVPRSGRSPRTELLCCRLYRLFERAHVLDADRLVCLERALEVEFLGHFAYCREHLLP